MIEIGSALDPGRKRITKKNQDSLCVIRPSLLRMNGSLRINWRPPLLVIADGMGGYEGGAVASQVVVESFSNAYLNAKGSLPPQEVLQAGITTALNGLKVQAEANPALDRMGSTVVAAILSGRSIYLLNVGDSRAYLINKNAVQQLSYDHSLVGEHLRQGLIQEEEVRTHPRRNVLSMSISAQREQVEPFTGVFSWQPGDHLVLCSDGLWGPVTEPQIQAVVLEYRPRLAAQKLVDLANNNQGPDNISVIIARFR